MNAAEETETHLLQVRLHRQHARQDNKIVLVVLGAPPPLSIVLYLLLLPSFGWHNESEARLAMHLGKGSIFAALNILSSFLLHITH